jgi:hypothetical protein
MSNSENNKWCVGDGCVTEPVGDQNVSELQLEKKQNSLQVRLNPTVVPLKFTRYRHPSHKHRMFMIISFGHNGCNNKNCGICIGVNKTMFRCFRCDYDLCGDCFQLDTQIEPVPLAEDDSDINESTITPVSNSFYVDPEY